MKKIIGFQNKGGMRLKIKLEIYDEEIVVLAGKKGMREINNCILLDARDLKLGRLVYYPAEEVLTEMEEIIDNAIMEKKYGI